MPLESAQCTNCGAQLNVDPSQKVTKCPYCHTSFITQEAIYYVKNVTNIGKLHADVIHISDEESIDNRVKAGETYIKMNDFASAEKIFHKLTEECPYDYRGWWGLIESYSRNFTDMNISRNELLNIKNLYNNACTIANPEEKASMDKKYKMYCDKIEDRFDTVMNNTNKKINKLTDRINQLSNTLESRKNILKEQNEKFKKVDNIIIIALSCMVLFPSIEQAIVNGSLYFIETLLGIGIMACGIYIVAKWILSNVYYKKTKNLKAEIVEFQMQLNTLNEEYSNLTNYLYEDCY